MLNTGEIGGRAMEADQSEGECSPRSKDLVVFEILRDSKCMGCGKVIWKGEFLFLDGEQALCLSCADFDHLEYLPRGDAALTRRAKKASRLSAVVVRFSRARGRYERQGLLVEEQALLRAEDECLQDEEVRSRRRQRAEAARANEDVEFQAAFAREIARQFPGCLPERAAAIAARAGARGSGRVGRTAAGRALDPEAISLAVAASVRHLDTGYDELLMSGGPRA